MIQTLVHIAYMVAGVLFITGLQKLSRVRSARSGNTISGIGMLIAVLATLALIYADGYLHVKWMIAPVIIGAGIGMWWARSVEMTGMPELVGVFNGFGGIASLLVAFSYFFQEVLEDPEAVGSVAQMLSRVPGGSGIDVAVTIVLSILVGSVTFSGSLVAAGKLHGWVHDGPVLLPGRHVYNVVLILGALGLGIYAGFFVGDPTLAMWLLLAAAVLSLLLGIGLTIPIGGADMPVIICLLNAYSGLAACLTGFVITNNMLIIAGALVGSSGFILTDIMCKAMNRSLANVLFGGFGAVAAGGGDKTGYKNVTSLGAEEAAMLLESASSVVFVPGYGLAVAQAQHVTAELGALLEKHGIKVSYAVHPVAGRMPGHMNVLLAEANVPYEQLYEMDAINGDFKNTDVVIILGANDVVNPVALHDKTSPIYGMPILMTHEARSVIIVKRSLGAGFANIKNELFEYPNASMFFSDAKKAMQAVKEEFAELKK